MRYIRECIERRRVLTERARQQVQIPSGSRADLVLEVQAAVAKGISISTRDMDLPTYLKTISITDLVSLVEELRILAQIQIGEEAEDGSAG